MLGTTELDYVQHLERGYCINHPDVVAQTKEQVVDRAVKQLLEALQANGFELDGEILKRGDGWLKYDAEKWQYSNDAGETWADIGSGGGGITDHTLLTNIGTNTHAQLDTHAADGTKHITDHVNLTNKGSNTHTQIDAYITNNAGDYALCINAPGTIAQKTFDETGFFTDNDQFTLVGIIGVECPTGMMANSLTFYKHAVSITEDTILEFGKDTDGKLFLKIGATTFTSSEAAFVDKFAPTEVGVMCDIANDKITFFYRGIVEAEQSISFPSFPSVSPNQEIHILGVCINATDMALYFLACSKELMFPQSSSHTPIRRGISQIPSPLFCYSFAERGGTTVSDAVFYVGDASDDYALDLDTNAYWQIHHSCVVI